MSLHDPSSIPDPPIPIALAPPPAHTVVQEPSAQGPFSWCTHRDEGLECCNQIVVQPHQWHHYAIPEQVHPLTSEGFLSRVYY
ncbi:hypothetical protein MTR67_023055 [Solanum verrucosum]|uniref:Uncharacterized protein n=1 Tax=Solanum verrucosum TaxID=315347 RepID=A0AAF0QZ04_SOLVR|nr:hypothetical protein MTR67_023055 [Solanum verrucosum]